MKSKTTRTKIAQKEEQAMSKERITSKAIEADKKAAFTFAAGVPNVVLLSIPDAIDRGADSARCAAVARETCAGTRILEAAARDAAGLGWQFHALAPDSRADRAGSGWEGWFTIGGKRLLVRIDHEIAEAPEALNFANQEAFNARAAQKSAEEEIEELQEDVKASEKDLKEVKKERDDLEDKLEAWATTIEYAIEGNAPAAISAAAKIDKKYKP